MRRRHQLQVNTFPFLAVLLCAMGSLILVLLVMDRRSHRAAQARAQEKLRLQAREEALARAMQREEYDAKRRARDSAYEKKRAALRNRVDAEERALSDELREVQERLAKTARRLEAEEAAVRKLRDQVKDEQERVALLLPLRVAGALLGLVLGALPAPGASVVERLLAHLLLRSVAGRQVRAPVHDQQHQDQRAHGTEQHRQEREGVDLQLLAASHAALP